MGCRFAYQLGRPAAADGDATMAGTLVLRLGTGIFVALNIMVFSWIFYSQELFGSAAFGATADALLELFSWLLMFLCSIVLVTLGLPLAQDAIDNLRGPRPFRPDTNLLICIGVGAAFGLSAWHTYRGVGRLYYDTAAMILVIVTLGHWLEAGARKRAGDSARALLVELPREAAVRRNGESVTIDVDDVQVGDVVAARVGETLIADGVVVDGVSHIDESSLTGEFRPRSVGPGDAVLAGSINIDGSLWLRAQSVGRERVVAAMERMLDEARTRQAPMQRMADRLAGWFVPLVMLIALAVLVAHTLRGDPARGLFDALSVLLISCPCALGLAAPLASWQALRLAARHGILIDSAATLERAAGVRQVMFDKTGTLTAPTLELAQTRTPGALDEGDALRIVAALESTSVHPIAGALVRAARSRGLPVRPATESRALPGLGIVGTVDGKPWCLGGARFLAHRGHAAVEVSRVTETVETVDTTDADNAGLQLYLFDGTAIHACFRLDETLRPDAIAAIDGLREIGVDAGILTGDSVGPAQAVAAQLGIPVLAGLLPSDKVAQLEAARRAGPVAMVGDGINDAPVLAAADVGIAAGSAADLASQAGNVRLVTDRLDRVPRLLTISRRAVGRIRLSLAWAFGYNGVGIALAAAGLLSPVFAASAMFVSSLVVLLLSRGAGRLPDSVLPRKIQLSSPTSLEVTAPTRTALP